MSALLIEPPPPPTGTKYKFQCPRGVPLATRTWAPPNGKPAKALILIVHGGICHSGYFAQLAQRLAAEQIFVASYDQPGCGYSEPDPAAPKGCTHLNSFDEVVDEVYEAVEWAKKEAGDESIPVYLLGESYGGLQVLTAAFECSERGVDLKGAIVLGSLIRLDKHMIPPWPVVKILTFLAACFPRVKMPATDFSVTFHKAFGDKNWAAAAHRDPKVCISPQFTLGAAAASLSSGEAVLKRAADFPVPLLAIHGKRDCRTQCEAVEEFVDRVGPRAEIVLIDTDGHQLLQDTTENTNAVIDKICEWLRNAVAS